jgi:hypothetical protein
MESFFPDLFGASNDIVTGYGSEQGFKACKTSDQSKCRDFKGKIKEIAEECLNQLRDPAKVSNNKLAILGFERRLVPTGKSMEMEMDSEEKIIA